MQNTLSAAVLLIGNELLSGQIRDLNLSHIAIELEKRGIRVLECRIIPDVEAEIIEAVNTLRKRYDYVFTTGGIGPTHDDITSDSIAKALGVKNQLNKQAETILRPYLADKSPEFASSALRMAHTPEGATLFNHNQSYVPGYRVENIYVMAGVPSIMKKMLDAVLDELKTGAPVLSLSVHANTSESDIAEPLESIQNDYPEVAIGSYPQMPDSKISNYRVIFVVKGTDLDTIKTVCGHIQKACQQLGHEAVIS